MTCLEEFCQALAKLTGASGRKSPVKVASRALVLSPIQLFLSPHYTLKRRSVLAQRLCTLHDRAGRMYMTGSPLACAPRPTCLGRAAVECVHSRTYQETSRVRPDPVQVLQASLTAVQVRHALIACRSTVAVSVDSIDVSESSRSECKQLVGQSDQRPTRQPGGLPTARPKTYPPPASVPTHRWRPSLPTAGGFLYPPLASNPPPDS